MKTFTTTELKNLSLNYIFEDYDFIVFKYEDIDSYSVFFVFDDEVCVLIEDDSSCFSNSVKLFDCFSDVMHFLFDIDVFFFDIQKKSIDSYPKLCIMGTNKLDKHFNF